ncbi:RB1-inducible coiled-coil protein 1 [Drosophila erecta]|uniref:RB1-inducible coiled-coil protein 1 n=1 Tax=Drosophila erecta TaxID=7220 RepID=UPI0007329D04|nr:RB1-inducible coiled-coil protein 1 [Drosophila erecta]XP_026831534.1 RB1-inducible coiled-coil protein 1 [Drosophila erecta]XP_026831535.1 RB1-inducible coiled-coil protein 1 [Drosophila erecta]XP_026831536.1 RB1-inducible coiled-coil protein 1 [Drosophila erecta]XP_026831537.1 RB1-inducible coiled-coil protein 1 [Drosophila erecta]XP_026831538.1 RB1-inducible coiled-coil protein 1 [Drosophila erecta]XP_026831539.1 RB1-inducible coiled-coil protein 1 [Drosophila erecta]EDV47934.2 unchara
MMLYVFHVDVGRMLSFDMNVALQPVEHLKETIQKLHNIPAANIVLLVSGGEMLTHSTQVSCYSAGTDTNPIYMFLTGDERLPPTIFNSDADNELRRQVEESHRLPPALETVRQRAQLAQHMRELARKEEDLCERLVHEQHLQQQGWSAVVANMEDLTNEFCDRFQNFCSFFDRHLQKRESFLELLRNFPDDLKQLGRIPILPDLMSLAEADFHGFDELLENDDVFTAQQQPAQQQQALTESSQADSPNKKLKMGDEVEMDSAEQPTESDVQALTSSSSLARRPNLNLLQWISSKGNHRTLQLMSDECIQGLDIFSAEIYEKLKEEVNQIIKLANQADVKEIKGLGDRLCKLEEFKFRIKKMVQEQKEQALALQQNEARAQNLRDNSVLPDLCLSHRSQLQVMLDNHTKIREYCRCIANSKDELGWNLHTRLRRIVWIENGMSEFDNRLLFNHRCLRRAERHISIIEQIHRAPSTYVLAVAEVVRRKIFSDEFRQWATRLSADFDRIHSEELRRRREFNASFKGHFLNILFPCMGDMPPAFANEHPLSFDTRLPSLSRSDMELLASQLPELAGQLQLPDMKPVIDFFALRSVKNVDRDQEQEPDMPLMAPRLAELQTQAAASDCETDTETEFEKLSTTFKCVATSTSTSLVERVAQSTATEDLLMLSAGTLTEENAGSLQRMRSDMENMSKLARSCLSEARSNVSTFRNDVANYQDELQSELHLLRDKCNVLKMLCEAREQKSQEKLEEMRLKLQLAEQEQQAAVAQAREQLIHEHKTELESLRCRFKLMTSMERSPSDSSLEKIERPTSSASVVSANASVDIDHLLAQQRQELLAQRERAISEAVDSERSLWQSRLLPLNSESVMANVGILKDMLADKERQLEQLREQNKILTQETYQLKTRLEMITNEDGNSWLKEKIDYLNKDKCRLEEELSQEKSRRQEMESSVTAMRNSAYDLNVGGPLTRSKSGVTSSHRSIALEGCARGDLVFVVWSMRHAQFMVVQDSLTLYFVHADSLATLQLTAPTSPTPALDPSQAVVDFNQIPLPYYAIGRVIDKEYCQARKDDNRYRVSRGSKFYRIKLAPLPSRNASRRERLESSSSAAAVVASPRDVIDAPSSSTSVYQSFKQRTVSITSVNEEDDESASLLSERCRYISVSEEDELHAAGGIVPAVTAAVATATSTAASSATPITTAAAVGGGPTSTAPTTATQAQSVITEQPTSSSKLKLDLLLASADIITQPLTQQPHTGQQRQELEQPAEVESAAPVAETSPNQTIQPENPEPETITIYVPPNAPAVLTATPSTSASILASISAEPIISTASMLPMSIGTAAISEDSDEYRSLEGKDDGDADDFAISG